MAVMSTTSSIEVAVQYAKSANALLFKLSPDSFHSRGVDISFLSAFVGECEYVYPPMTYVCRHQSRTSLPHARHTMI